MYSVSFIRMRVDVCWSLNELSGTQVKGKTTHCVTSSIIVAVFLSQVLADVLFRRRKKKIDESDEKPQKHHVLARSGPNSDNGRESSPEGTDAYTLISEETASCFFRSVDFFFCFFFLFRVLIETAANK
jgi:hypothetical protein